MNSKILFDITRQDQKGVITKKDLQKVYLRSIPMEFTWNYERQMHFYRC